MENTKRDGWEKRERYWDMFPNSSIVYCNSETGEEREYTREQFIAGDHLEFEKECKGE